MNCTPIIIILLYIGSSDCLFLGIASTTISLCIIVLLINMNPYTDARDD